MMNGYHRLFPGVALQMMVQRFVDIPNPNLAIEKGEILHSLSLPFEMKHTPETKIKYTKHEIQANVRLKDPILFPPE